jgi:predicted CXXCH cytochrome family protein
MKTRSLIVLLAAAGLCAMLSAVGCLHDAVPNTGSGSSNAMGSNLACYVCHMTYVKEPLSRVHLKHKVYCIDCHGVSADHANDEDIGATKPDICFKRSQVNDACRKCHSKHNAAPEKLIKRWTDRKLTKTPPVCTDCHGTHKIKREKDQ